MTRFFCVYLPDFAARAAVESDPSLQGQAVVIHAKGRVVAATPAARAAGVQKGWTLNRVQSLLPDVVTMSFHAPTVTAAWDGVLASLFDLTPCVESVRCGVAMADIRPAASALPLIRQWAAQGGVADDRTTAELAALSAQPGTLRTVQPGRGIAFLRRVPTALLQEVGARPETIQRLHWFGWYHISDLRRLTKRQLIAQFRDGELLYRYAQASDAKPVARYTPPPTICQHYPFETAAQEPGELEPVLDHLLRVAYVELNERTVLHITVAIETPAGWHRKRRLLREATGSFSSLQAALRHALYELMQPDTPVSTLAIQLGGLAQVKPVQEQLFSFERPSVQTALRAVERRFPAALQRAIIVDPHTILPEESFYLEPVAIEDDTPKTTRQKAKHSQKAKQAQRLHSGYTPQWARQR